MYLQRMIALGVVVLLISVCGCRERTASADSANSAWKLEPAFPSLKFRQPVDLQAAPDNAGMLYVVEQPGTIRAFKEHPDTSKSSLFLDIRERVASGGEMGLLGLAFGPDYGQTGHFYVNYTATRPLRTVVSRFRAVDGRGDAASEQVLLTIRQPYRNHNGGQLQFGPDGMLYIGVGDGGAGGDPHNHGQSPRTLLGNILRIDVSGGAAYSIPPDNPFVGNDRGWREEIWAYGFRNPWRFSFDSVSGALWTGDVGQNKREEVHRVEKGGNHGWRRLEGTLCYDPKTSCRGGTTFV